MTFQDLVGYIEELGQTEKSLGNMLDKIMDKVQEQAGKEKAQKPTSDLWGQHKQMIKLAQDHGLHLAANWAVNMSGRTFSEAKPAPVEASVLTANPLNGTAIKVKATAEDSLVEDIINIIRTEPELPGEPDEKTMAAMEDVGPIMNARIAVKTTKECIEERVKEYFSRYRPASPAVEELVSEIKSLRDRRYCEALDYAKRTECRGWEYKSKNGLFGVAEFKAHEKVNTLMGEHKGLHEALDIIAKYDNAKGGSK